MKKNLFIIFSFIYCQTIFSQPVTFAPLPNSPMGKALCFAYNSTANRIWVCTSTKVFYSDDNGGLWVNTPATGVIAPGGIALNAAGTPYIVTPQHGMRHFNGTAWIADNNGLPVNPMPQFSSLAIDAAGNVYAGAGWHGVSGNYCGVWKWNGTTWATMNTGLPTAPIPPAPEILSIVIDAGGNLFAGTAKVLLNAGGQGFGVYKWNGSSWNTYGTGLSNLNVASLAINSSGELFAGTFNCISHISATVGGAWTNSTTGLPATATTVRSVTFDALNNIYAGLGYLPDQAGSLFGSVYISNNNGASWAQSNAIANTTTAINAMTTDNAGNIFAGATGVYKSANQGNTWIIDTVGIIKARPEGGYIAINSLGHIFSAGRGDVFKSMDGGVTWQLIINGIDRQDMTCIAVDKNDNIYLGGQIWVGGSVRSDSGRVWKSTDGGNTWIKANVHDQQISEFKVAGNGDVFLAHVFGTVSNIAVTHDGTNWIDLNIYSAANPNGYGCFSVDVNKLGHIFGTTELGQVRRSTDGGATFVSSTNLPGGNVHLVRISPHNNIFINGPPPFGTPPLYYSDSANNGTTFTQSAKFPVGKSITDIAFDNRDSMYVGTQGGLYTTSLPFNPATSTFTLNASNGLGAITGFAKDPCGYLYMSNIFAVILKTTVPVDNTSGCNVVALHLTDFTAAYGEGKKFVNLKWETENENNVITYSPEKSMDGIHFKTIGTIAGNTNQSQHNVYSLRDNNITSAVNYYRIKQNDNNEVTYSNIIRLEIGRSPFSFSIAPNPVENNININFSLTGNRVKFEVFNSLALKVVTLVYDGRNNLLSIPAGSLKTGFYFIKKTNLITGESTVVSFIKS